MSDLTPREAVYLLARTQNAWIPLRGTLNGPDGFADGQDLQGRQLRWLSCPDCLANGRPMFGCETCHGRGEVPDDSPDPMRVRASGGQAFFGHDQQEARDRAQAIDAQILRLRQTARQREGLEDPEDWLTRSIRVKQAQWETGDYRLLEQAQDLLGVRDPGRHWLWMRAVVDELPIARQSRRILDEVADWLAAKMLAAIALENVRRAADAELLGLRKPRLRSAAIVVPVELQAAQAAGKGRWGNQHAQGQRNALVVGMAADGKTAGEIARKVGLTKRRVQQLLAGIELADVATGPAA